MILLAILSVLVLLISILVFRQSVVRSAGLSLLVALSVTSGAWQMPARWIEASLIKGLLLSVDIGLILFSALLLASTLDFAQVLTFFKHAINDITTDKRIQAVLLGWFGVAIIEGASGFGTPIMLVAPLLVTLGFKPQTSVIVCLLGNSVSSVFGASGVPVTIGLAEGLSQLPYGASISLPLVAAYKTTLILLTGSLVPLLITLVVSHLELGSWKKAFTSWPFALLSGALYTIISLLVSWSMGPELPSLLAGLIGFIFMSFYAATHPNFRDQVEEVLEKFYTKKDIAKAVLPYVLIVALLSLSRATYLNIGPLLRATGVTFNLASTSLTHTFNPLYSPATILLLVTLMCWGMYRVSRANVSLALKQSLKALQAPFLSLTTLLMLVTLLRYSSNNALGISGIPQFLGEALSQFPLGNVWLIAAPFIGALGAFLAGSVTVSNMMLATVQVEAGVAQGLQPELVLALQSLGAGLGNMFALHNVIAGLSVVKSPGSLWQILIFNALVAFCLLLLTGVTAWILW